MSVQVLIQRSNGKVVFTQTSPVAQSDMVFWHNADSDPHYPVPGCGNLRVGPKQSTESYPYQGFPDITTYPYTLSYDCALHKGESGTIVVDLDFPSTPASNPLPGPPGIDNQNVPIHISNSGGKVTFETVDVAQGDTVYWINDDAQEHWPVPNCMGLLTKPGTSSNELQPATFDFPRSPAITTGPYGGPAPLPMSITYGCAIAGHQNERGTINIYDNLAVVPAASQSPLTALNTPVIVVTGGKSPYTIVQDSTQPSLKLQEQTPAGSSSGVAVLQIAAMQNGTVTLNINVTDALNKQLIATTTITIQGSSNS